MFQPVMLQLITYGQLLLWTSLVLTANADEVNIAHLATISATPHNTYNGNDYKKENAVDGHIDTSSNNVDNCGCCYASRAADDLHFTASFAGHYHVQQIVIIGRQVAVTPAQSLSDITVHLDDIPVQVDTSGTNRATVTSTSGSVQTLRITRRQTSGRLLFICEISVMATATNIAPTASLTASPFLTFDGRDYTKDQAVDGEFRGDATTCDCCYCSADNLVSPYLQADLRHPLNVSRIVIEGRKDKRDENTVLTGVVVKLDSAAAPPAINRTINYLVVIPTSPLQVIRIEKPTRFLMICELKVFVAKCGDGFYGYECNNACPPNCAGPCDYKTGSCVVGGGCLAGFIGDYCSTSCSTGTFGPDCVYQCHCKDNAPCNATGHCATGCTAGWSGPTCSQACADGKYGENCAHSCRCMNFTTCDKALGSCSAGCNYGWTGFNCSTTCADGKYGENCAYSCKCVNYTTCDKARGNCSYGCDYGWTGVNCSIDLNLLPRIKDSTHTSMSSVDRYMNSSLAVDGRYDLVSSFLACSCCSVTSGTEKPWWQLDLGRLYLIQDIYVIGRQRDYQQQSSQIISTISNSTHGNGTLTLSSNQSLGPTVYFYSFEQPRVFQYLTVSKQVRARMTICEVILIEGECPEHSGSSFGDKCSRTCHCADGKPCDRATGTCQSPGCLPGWTGDACDEACPHGSFGDHCSENCHCLNNANCKTMDGTCPNHLCAAGWTLYNCSQACSRGSFGDNCSETCHCLNDANCNNVNGNCENHLCAAGWRLDNCSQVCLHGTFGHNCSTECHCLSDEECDHAGGACPSGLCEPGWQQDSCSQECDERTFGMNCLSECHCYNSSSCDKVHGTCFQYTDRCEAGWLSDSCSVVLASSVDHADTSSAGLSVTVAAGMAVGGVAVGMLLMMGIALLVLRLTRRHIVRSDRSHDVVAGRPQTDGHVSATEMHDVSSAIEVAGEGAQYEALDEPAADTPHIYTGLAQHPDEGVQYEALGGTDDSSHVYTGLAEQAATGDYTASHDSQYVNMFGK